MHTPLIATISVAIHARQQLTEIQDLARRYMNRLDAGMATDADYESLMRQCKALRETVDHLGQTIQQVIEHPPLRLADDVAPMESGDE